MCEFDYENEDDWRGTGFKSVFGPLKKKNPARKPIQQTEGRVYYVIFLTFC